jgi:hypothetical protein
MGHKPADRIPEWVHDLRLANFPLRIFPIGDKRWREYFKWCKDHGCNGVMGFGWMWKRYKDVLCAISPEDGTLPLDEEHGANEDSVKAHNWMLHHLGMKSIVWTPTTGASPYSKSCEQNPEWFIRGEDGKPIGSWYKGEELWLADSNPFSEGYHRYWRDLIFKLVDWNFDGIFLDGVIARPSD